jgi:predicted nucleic acid-binding protein
MHAAADRFFVDTNVLLYSLDRAEAVKRPIAASWVAALWESGCGATSWQVLNEFYSNAVRKVGLPVSSARNQVKQLPSGIPWASV